jgi:hypothetical protein
MKVGLACNIIRRCGIMKHRTNKDISFVKNLMCPNRNWVEFIKYILTINYISKEGVVPNKAVMIPELNMSYGGTLVVEVDKNGNKKSYMDMS